MPSLNSDSGPSRRLPAARVIADYERPSLSDAPSRARAFAHRLGAARDGDDAISIVRSWNELRSSVYTQRTRAQVRHYQNTADQAAKNASSEKRLLDIKSRTSNEE